MRKVDDPDRGVVFYYDKTSPTESNKEAFYLFVGRFGPRSPFIMMRIQDAGEDYLNISSYQFIIDGETYDLEPESENDIIKGGQPPEKVKILNKKKPEEFEMLKGMCFEYYERSVRAGQVEMLQKLASSQVATIIYIGEKGQKSHIVTAAEKKAVANILKVFLQVGGDYQWLRN